MNRLSFVVWWGLVTATVVTAAARVDTTCLKAASTSKEDTRVLDCYPYQAGFPNATEEFCLAQGCCWDSSRSPQCVFGTVPVPTPTRCSAVPVLSRVACRNPRYFIRPSNASDCTAMGCCFDESQTSTDPNTACFQPAAPGYHLTHWEEVASGYSGTLMLSQEDTTTRGPFGNDIATLSVHVHLESPTRVRVRIFDPSFPRYEVPLPLFNASMSSSDQKRLYGVSVTTSPFGLAITRLSTNEVLFNSTPGPFNGPLVFSNQFLELSTSVPSSPKLFGLGEHVGRLVDPAHGDHYTLWTRDRLANAGNAHTASGGDNEYGVYPFYIRVEQADPALAHGVFILGSNAMEVVASPDAITFRTVGGIVDLFVFLGPTAREVVGQFASVVGRPALPPYWALGYHLCRYHYANVAQVRDVVHRMRAADVPQDAQWTDIDVLDGYFDFTWDNTTFPHMDSFVQHDLHAFDVHFVPIVDAGIGLSRPTDPAYVDGLDQRVFMADESNSSLEVGRVWPGDVAFPDFFHPNASIYWEAQLRRYYKSVAYDGIWLDMNEPSSFCTDSDTSPTSCAPPSSSIAIIRSKDCMFPMDPFRQPFAPGQHRQGGGNLATMTASLAAHQFVSSHYNLHSLYGHSEVRATREAIDRVRTKRSFVLSRSTFAGDGQYAAHWLGDNSATWEDLRLGVAGVLAMNVMGMPMVGPDTCGFDGNTTKELCIRWHQAAILFPFLRNHNAAEKDQAPVDFDSDATAMIRHTLRQRYQLLPYLYTQLYRMHVDGGAVVIRPLYFEFPSVDTFALDAQYLVGPALLVSPVLDEGAVRVRAYFPPEDDWYDLWTGEKQLLHLKTNSSSVDLDVPLGHVPVHIRGGYIVPEQLPGRTTTASRQNPFHLAVALPSKSATGAPSVRATGDLYMDSGDSLDPVTRGVYTLVSFAAIHYPHNGFVFITGRVDHHGFDGPQLHVPFRSMAVYGVQGFALGHAIDVECVQGTVTSSGTSSYNATTGELMLQNLQLVVGEPFEVRVFPTDSSSKHPVWGPTFGDDNNGVVSYT
ncbi:hypothetical protein H257_08029 [Aphanomyces astaci]|uniref:Maltase n=1 Tax=Aphanomyces astaci TaxID=112090 RepID=W4GFP4_APHAT|nr:hypothetical protein H257_08029 [Aphanomyces astaci]ETV78512.1 hypothetical protein H257_08029 [Aphanomyces astaci]|eukprot:XP_009832093.1 hypothetical protein H257_08029 [Aphanomyces astaci]